MFMENNYYELLCNLGYEWAADWLNFWITYSFQINQIFLKMTKHLSITDLSQNVWDIYIKIYLINLNTIDLGLYLRLHNLFHSAVF